MASPPKSPPMSPVKAASPPPISPAKAASPPRAASPPKELPKELPKVVEGIFAINKPQWASSAGVLRDLQTHFQPSPVFAPWLTSQKRNMELSGGRKRAIDNLKVKVGHGGTLDPLATGVLIVGVGKGTKCLQRFLECTKTYECVILFGAATDSYDAVGKIVSRAPYEHVTKELVEEKLAAFRGKIMQKPSIFSALKVDGKKMYEYARAGGEIPEVAARPVEVKELELIEFLEPGTHEFKWPEEEVGGEERVGAEKLLGIRDKDARHGSGKKRSRSPSIEKEELDPKKLKTEDEPVMSGALPVENTTPEEKPAEAITAGGEQVQDAAPTTEISPIQTSQAAEPAQVTEAPKALEDPAQMEIDQPESEAAPEANAPLPQPPAARLRMTVTSGFYVRSLCHDLGLACESLGLMSALIRSRQGDYELSKNVLEYTDLEAGPEVWEPKVQAMLEESMKQENWEPELVEDEETWQEKMKDRVGERQEGDRNRSYQGSGSRGGGGGWKKGGGNWKGGRGGRNNYSKDNQGGS